MMNHECLYIFSHFSYLYVRLLSFCLYKPDKSIPGTASTKHPKPWLGRLKNQIHWTPNSKIQVLKYSNGTAAVDLLYMFY